MGVHTHIPDELIAGDTWRFLLDLGDYPAPTWVATLYIESMHGQTNAAAAASGAQHSITITAATTAAVKPGRYQWRIRAESAGIVETVLSGSLEVLPDPAAAGNRDTRADSRRMLDALEAALLGRASADQLAITIAGRTISRTPLPELIAWRDRLRTEVRSEEKPSGKGRGRTLKARISRGY